MTAPDENAGRKRRAILVAEDNEAHRLVLTRVMRNVHSHLAIELDFVETGEAALARIAQASGIPRPDILLLDLHMPGLSGIETLRLIRMDESLRSIPVVILSSSDDARHVEQAYVAGANAYLVKRGDYTALVEQMRLFTAFWLETALIPGTTAP